jgi:hypothetical protein
MADEVLAVASEENLLAQQVVDSHLQNGPAQRHRVGVALDGDQPIARHHPRRDPLSLQAPGVDDEEIWRLGARKPPSKACNIIDAELDC